MKRILNRNAAASRGFTLIELLLAFFILSLMLGITFSVISGVNRSKGALEDARSVHIVLDSLVLRLSREIQLAAQQPLMPPRSNLTNFYPQGTSLIGERKTLDGGIRADSLEFIASGAGQYLVDGSGNSGLVQICYRLEPNPDRTKDPEAEYYLVREETPVKRPYDKAYEKQIIFPIAKNVIGFELRYLDPQAGWSEDWQAGSHTGLPLIVAFTLRIKAPSGVVETFTTSLPLLNAAVGQEPP